MAQDPKRPGDADINRFERQEPSMTGVGDSLSVQGDDEDLETSGLDGIDRSSEPSYIGDDDDLDDEDDADETTSLRDDV